jgi:hypothetical protein
MPGIAKSRRMSVSKVDLTKPCLSKSLVNSRVDSTEACRTLWRAASNRDFQLKKISALHNRIDITTKEVRPMSLQCPRCNSPKVASFNHAMKVGAAIGAVGGVARGISAALAGSQTGAALGAFAGPVGITLGSVSGAILGGLAGGVGGCALGAQLGESLDRHVLAHNLCLLCGHRFNLPA